MSVSLTGVFCHQTPQVSFVDSAGRSRRCELADLLVVVDDLTSGEQGRRWAVLVQAKMAARFGGITLRAPGDLVQLDLLSNWPRFNLPAGFAPGERDFRTCGHRGAALDCGTYGLIDSQVPAWRQQPPAKVMPAGGDELGTFLAHMLEDGQIGYGREATGLDDDWSKTVEELTQTTAALAFTHAAGLTGRYPRGNTGVAFCIAGDGLGDAKGSWGRRALPSGDRPEPDDDRPGQGISTLRIAVHQSEADGER